MNDHAAFHAAVPADPAKRQGRLPEVLALLLFLALISLVSAFHEPWFDEAQSWMIARDASLFDILFKIPHYEGHPPLWHLMLAPFAKLGAPYEASIKLVSILIGGGSACLLLFRSPFPRPLRLALPFTYFIFYQYGVISRPYCLMGLAFLLAAIAYEKRAERPFAYALCLMLLSASSAYGIVLAGGMGLCWLLEFIAARRGAPASLWLRGRSVSAMLSLLIFALLLIALICPLPSTYAIGGEKAENTFLLRLVYTLFVLPAEALLYNVMPSNLVLEHMRFSSVVFAVGLLVGLVVWAALLLVAYRKRKLSILLIPYGIAALFFALVYFSRHHVGVVTLYFLFLLWVCCAESREERPLPKAISTALADGDARLKFKKLSGVAVYAVLAIQLVWSLVASIQDIRLPYDAARGVAAFIQEQGLEDCNIMVAASDKAGQASGNRYVVSQNPPMATAFLPYFDRNIFCNFNEGNADIGYEPHYLVTRQEYEATFRSWRAAGAPELLIGRLDFAETYPEDEYKMMDYAAVYKAEYYVIWKASFCKHEWYYLYMRRDLLAQYGLTEVEEEPYFEVE